MAGSSILARMAVIIDGQTANFNKAMAQSQGQLAGFQKSIGAVSGVLLATFGTAALFRGISDAVSIMAQFEATMSEVKAITGATGEEFKALERDALKLGAATKFTSAEVGQLQIAFGRLGFNTKEILDATEATLDLAAATGEDLAKSADVAGSTVRGFGLQAKETQRVVDVMAKSFNTTALSLENFSESMKFVAPIANAANISVEETTALLGTLADAGIRGSLAGTALRKILTDLPKDSRPFQDRLDELSKKGITVSDAFDEVGRTAQTALLILAKNNDKTKELAASFQNVAGEASKMARIMQDNLQGDAEKLTSAWEGLILALGNTNAFRSATQGLTAFFNSLSGTPDADEGLRQLVRSIQDESEPAIEAFIERLKDIRRETGKPIDLTIIESLANKYELTSAQTNKLFSSLLEVNKALSFQEQVIKNFKESSIVETYGETAEAVDLYKQNLYELILAEQIKIEQNKKFDAALGGNAFADSIKNSETAIQSARRQIIILNEFSKDFVDGQKEVVAANVLSITSLDSYKNSLKALNEEFEHTALSMRGFGAATSSNLRVIASEIAAQEQLIESVERVKNSFKDFDFTLKIPPPDTADFLDPISKVTKTEGAVTFDLDQTLSDSMIERFEEKLAKLSGVVKKTTGSIKEDFISLTAPISNAISGIAEAIGSAVVGVGDFGQEIIKVVAGFAKQLGQILIATGVAMIAAKALITNPYTAIIAGIALVALASAASAAISKSHSSSFGGSAGGREVTNAQRLDVQSGQSISFNAKFRIEGKDLVAAVNSTNNAGGRLGG